MLVHQDPHHAMWTRTCRNGIRHELRTGRASHGRAALGKDGPPHQLGAHPTHRIISGRVWGPCPHIRPDTRQPINTIAIAARTGAKFLGSVGAQRPCVPPPAPPLSHYLVARIAAAAAARAFASFLLSNRINNAKSPLALPAAALRVRASRLDTRRERAVATAATVAAAAVEGVSSRDDCADRARSWRVSRRAAEEDAGRRGAMCAKQQ